MYQKLDFFYIMFFEIVLLAYMQTIIYIILPRKYTTVFVKTKKESADAIFRQIQTYKKILFLAIPPSFFCENDASLYTKEAQR